MLIRKSGAEGTGIPGARSPTRTVGLQVKVETVEIYNLHRSTLFRSDFTEF
jgi:hypothetical protein